MNTSYRSVYNDALGAWVAASELSRTGGKRQSAGATLATALLVIGSFGVPSSASAASECGVDIVGADTLTCTAAAYAGGITYTGSDGLTLNLANPAMVVGPVATPGVSVQSSGTSVNAMVVNVQSAGMITSTGAAQHAVVVRSLGSAGDATATMDAGTVSVSYGNPAAAVGSETNGLFAAVGNAGSSASANATLNGGTINTAAYKGNGVAAANAGTGDATARITGGTVATTGVDAYGLYGYVSNPAGAGHANVSMEGGAVTTSGTQGFGLRAVNFGRGDANIGITNGRVTTTGNFGYGAYSTVSNTGSAATGRITMDGGSVVTSGAAGKGLAVQNNGVGDSQVTVNRGSVATSGSNADGVEVYGNNTSGAGTVGFALTGGSVATQGAGARGVSTWTIGTGNVGALVSGGRVSTTGDSATALWTTINNTASTGAVSATLQGGTVTTTGNASLGLLSQTNGLGAAAVTITNGDITTSGPNAHATMAFVNGGTGTGAATANMSGGSITASGAGSQGLYADNGGRGNAAASVANGSIVANAGGVLARVSNGSSAAATSARMTGGSVRTNGTGAVGVYAFTVGLGDATAVQSAGTIETTGAAASGLSATTYNTANTGAMSATMSGGTIAVVGTSARGVMAYAGGLGSATAAQTAGDIRTAGTGGVGVYGWAAGAANTAMASATSAGGTITTTGSSAGGLYARHNGLGAASATLDGGVVTTSGDTAVGVLSEISSATSASASTVDVQSGRVATSGDLSHAVSASTVGAGLASVRMSGGTTTASGADADGVRARSDRGTYAVALTGGSATGGSGTGAAIHTLAAGGGTIDIGSAVLVDGAASGLAIRDGDATGSGTDAVGGNAVVTTAGTVTGDAVLGLGNDSLSLNGGTFSGNLYGDDRVASTNDGNDNFRWIGGTLNGGFYGQNGSDTAWVSAAAYHGSTVLDGGDDVFIADGWVDRLTLQGVTATAGGAQLLNWESITLDNTRLTLAGAPLVVGAGLDAGGTPLGLFINPTSTVTLGASTFAVIGDVHNAGVVDLRNAAGTPGNTLTINGNYAGTIGLVKINTALGSDASATDKLVVNGNTSGTTRLQVTNAGGTGAATVNGIQVVQVTGSSSDSNFALASPVQAGAYEYGLHRGGRTDGDANSFYLSSVYAPPPTPEVIPPTPAPAPAPAPEVLRPAVPGYVLGQVASNELGLGLLGSLHKRVGEQQTAKWDYCGCDDKAPADQVWGRLHAQRLDIDGKRQFGAEQDLQFLQFGKDLSIAYSGDPGDKSRTHTGLSMGYGRTTTDFGDRRRGDAGMGYDTGKMKGQMATLGAYHTRYADNGSYLDLVGQLHAVHNKYTDKYGGEGTQKGAGFGLSAEVGRPWQIGESQWLIEPQAQLSYQATRYKGFADDVSSVDGFTGQSLRARLGGRLAWNDKAQRTDKLTRTNTFYVTADLLHEFMDPEAVTIGGTSVRENWAKKTWAEVGVGAQLPLSKSTYLYGGLQYQRSLGDRSREGISGQVGVRVAW